MNNKFVYLLAALAAAFLILKIIKKEVKEMVAVYVALIIAHRRTLARVPKQLQEAVLADLTALGLDGEGNPVEEPAE